MDETLTTFLREERDRRAVEAVLLRYFTLVDAGQLDTIEHEIYTHDAVDEHGTGPIVGRTAIGEFIRSSFPMFERVFHTVSNVVIDLDGDDARAQSYVTAWHWYASTAHLGASRPADWVVLAVTKDHLQRTADGWRIRHRIAHPVGLGVGSVPDTWSDAHEAPITPDA